MTIFCLDILLHGIVPALTGGFYYDFYTTPLANTVHIYLWICFMTLPLLIYLFSSVTVVSFIIYPSAIAILFFFIKFINYRLHKFFDLAVRYDENTIDSKKSTVETQRDIEEEQKIVDSTVPINQSTSETQPLWIDSLYGSNNSNLPSIYDDSYTRVPRSNATTTNEYQIEPSNPSARAMTCFAESTDEPLVSEKEYCMIKEFPVDIDAQERRGSDVNLRQTSEKDPFIESNRSRNSMRRIQSDGTILLLNPKSSESINPPTSLSSVYDRHLNKKSKSVTENFQNPEHAEDQKASVVVIQQEQSAVKEKSQTRLDQPAAVDLPIDDWRPILQILENVFADEDGDTLESNSVQPDPLEPLLQEKSIYFENQNYSSKSVEQRQADENEFPIPTRFRRSTSNQGGRRRRNARRATSVEQRPPFPNENTIQKRPLSPSASARSYRQTTTTLRALRDEISLQDDSVATTPSDESSQLITRVIDRPRWIPVYQENSFDPDSSSQIIDEAEWHNETSPGTIHYFRDETGKLFSYVFGDASCQARLETSDPKPLSERIQRSLSEETETIGENTGRENRLTPPHSPTTTFGRNHESYPFFLRCHRHYHPRQHHRSGNRSRRIEFVSSSSGRPVIITDETRRQILGTSDHSPQEMPNQPREHQTRIKHRSIKGQSYRLKLFNRQVTVPFDRLWLLTVFDRDRSIAECILCIILAILVSIIGMHVLNSNIYYDIEVLIFCCVMAASQYSLLKSCQPDVNTPVHGFNRNTAISRAIYFCLLASLLLLINYFKSFTWHLVLFGTKFTNVMLCHSIYNVLSISLLCSPLLFLFGLLPQCSTFFLCLLENIDMHIFGGTAMISIPGALYSVFLSIVNCLFLSTIGYYGLLIDTSKDRIQNILFSVYCGLTVSICYKLSRGSSNPTILWKLVKNDLLKIKEKSTGQDEIQDPLPNKLKLIVKQRFQSDILLCLLIFILTFAAHASTTFTSLQPKLNYIISSMVIFVGVTVHYILPQLRKQLPWLLFSEPILKQADYSLFEPSEATKVLWFEKFFVWAVFIEKNILLPCTFLGALSHSAPIAIEKFGLLPSVVILTICSMKMLRIGYCNCSRHFLYVLLTTMMTYTMDSVRPETVLSNNMMTSNKNSTRSETFLLNYFLLSSLTEKLIDFQEKLSFIFVYCAPWQISWGSAFHAIAQPFCIPHSAILMVQCLFSSLLNSPIMPLLGSAAFISSYPRPIKFWEKNYNTERIDNTNLQLQAQIEEFECGLDDNNLNAIFYEHLSRVLQHSLAGEIQLGRLGKVNTGDFFILTSDSLNCMIHLIEIGNGFITFQLRGLEFKGTYCQQREVEAITEDMDKNRGLCCCEAGRFPYMLSLNAAFTQRWLAWEVLCLKFVVDGYSIKENKFYETVVGYDLRKRLISLMIKSVIFYAIRADDLVNWLENEQIRQAMMQFLDPDQVDVDPSFTTLFDDDFKVGAGGVTKKTFSFVYGSWIMLCNSKRITPLPSSQEDDLISLCFILSLLARRTLFSSPPSQYTGLLEIHHENFVHGFYSLFKGDFRLAPKDEWAFADMALLKNVVAKGVRMSLKLNQDSFLEMSEYLDHEKLYDDIAQNDANLIITHEASPEWHNAILSNKPSLLALRRTLVESIDEYRIVMLDRRHLSFRVVKVSKECVRGFWASQQHELIFLRNRNPERGSIQNAKQVLRNMINSSSDQPIGYPIFVSPLITSYSSTSQALSDLLGGELAWDLIRRKFSAFVRRAQKFFLSHCVGNASGTNESIQLTERRHTSTMSTHARQTSFGAMTNSNPTDANRSSTIQNQNVPVPGSSNDTILNSHLGGNGQKKSLSTEHASASNVKRVSDSQMTIPANAEEIRRRSSASTDYNSGDRPIRKVSTTMNPSTLSVIHNTKESNSSIHQQSTKSTSSYTNNGSSNEKVVLIDTTAIYDSINLGRRIDVIWPNEQMRLNGGRNVWSGWTPAVGMTGLVVHRWIPRHSDARQRSHIDKCILLVHIDKHDKFVPIAEHGVRFIGESTYL